MHETTAETGTHVSSHPGKDTEDALSRATGQMRTYVRDHATEWHAEHDSSNVAMVRAHITALSATTSVTENGFPMAHIVFAYEVRVTYTD